MVVVILALMWVLVLVPPLLRSRSDGRPSSSVVSFRRQLSTLGRANPMPYARVPARPTPYRAAPGRSPYGGQPFSSQGHGRPFTSPAYGHPGYGRPAPSRLSRRSVAKQRRQTVLLTLVALAFLTAVLAFGMGMSSVRWAHFGVDLLLVGYVFALVQLRRAEEQRAAARQWNAWHQQAA